MIRRFTTKAQTNPDLIRVGTGKANNSCSSSWGDDVYTSDNGGKDMAAYGPLTPDRVPS